MDNRYDESLLRNEVIYLHSLWHQGPPPPPNPNPIPLPNRSGILHFTNPATSFKKKAKTRTRLDSGTEWPVVEIIQDLPTSGWREFKPKPKKPDPPIKPLSDEEQARLSSLQMQQRVLETCRGFFISEEEDDEDDEDEDDMVDGDGIEGSKEYKFLVEIFIEDKELRRYYECHHETGEFFCLVCCGIGNKAPKKFKGGIALVQHSNSVLKTNQTRAHRAFGHVVCKVLGIDTNRLPVIIFNCEPLGRSLGSSQEKQCNVNKEIEVSFTKMNADNGKLETSLPVASGEVQYRAPETVDGTHDLQLIPRDASLSVEGNDELMADEDNGEDVTMYHKQTAAENISIHSQPYRQEASCSDQGPSTSKLFEDNQEHVAMYNPQTNNHNKDGQSASCIKDVCSAGEGNSVLKSFELGVCDGCTMPSLAGSTTDVGSQPDLQEDIDAHQKFIVVKEMRKCNLGDN